eukprot:g19062.t1
MIGGGPTATTTSTAVEPADDVHPLLEGVLALLQAGQSGSSGPQKDSEARGTGATTGGWGLELPQPRNTNTRINAKELMETFD